MAVIKCKMCGGDLILEEGSNVAECEYCGSRQTVPSADNEKKLNLFARANRLRANNEFDKAAGVYESIVADFPEEAEAYWGLILCKYGIEYVDDPGTGKKIPTCHRSSFDSVMDDPNFELVMEYADPIARRVYREEAKQIEELRKRIIEVSSKEEPYDIFICYKETDENGQRTLDSVLAQDVYDMLTENGYRVFFSRVTLEDKLGVEYEPYIFAALNSAKIMLAFGTDYDYYNAVWVKNEWSRFLQLIAKGEKKTLIPCYKNIDAYDMPKEFAKLQAQDLGKVGANQDLLRGIKKILPKGEEKQTVQSASQKVVQSGPNVTALLKRGFMALEDKQWGNAKEFFDQVLSMDAENHDAYLGIVMANASLPDRKAFRSAYIDRRLKETAELKRAKQFANSEQAALWQKLGQERKGADKNKSEQQNAERAENKKRLSPLRSQLLPLQELIAVGELHTVGLKVDGSVVATGSNISGECNVSGWSNIVAIAATGFRTFGLKADGTVVAVGSNDYGQCGVSGWTDIVAVSAGNFHTVGLKADGTVVATKYTGDQVLYHGQCDVSGWTGIVAIAASGDHTVGLKADGTVEAVGNNEQYQCSVSNWKDIVAIAAGYCSTVGLKSDGTVVTIGRIWRIWDNIDDQRAVREWNDIVAIAAGPFHVVGLKSDGTVVAVGNNDDGQCDVSGWRNIVAIAAGNCSTVGLKSDGTVEAVGRNDDGQCNVSGWRLFQNYTTLENERKEADMRRRQTLSQQISVAQHRLQALRNELANLKGLFSGKRRKELETEIAALNAKISDQQKQIAAIKD